MSVFIKKHKMFLLLPITLVLFIIFFLLLGNQATAEAGNLNEMKGYESVLIKDGDTLTTIADTYAKEYSHYTNSEYLDAIVSLNSLSTEHIQSGGYLLLPKYR